MNRCKVVFVSESRPDPLNIVIIDEVVQPHVLKSELAFLPSDRVSDLEIVVIIVSAVQGFVQMVVGHRVKCVVICPP